MTTSGFSESMSFISSSDMLGDPRVLKFKIWLFVPIFFKSLIISVAEHDPSESSCDTTTTFFFFISFKKSTAFSTSFLSI